MSVENGVRFGGGGGGEARAEYRNVGLMPLIFVDDRQPAQSTTAQCGSLCRPVLCVKAMAGTGVPAPACVPSNCVVWVA